ncbi:nucleotidyl transferase AbiEii/AbiGii toxin family protein [Mesohalobacter halotolerans]|uniref:Nucleotidyl transferase AbiEii/AbiGii toxin family protein n=1 Tax=Mesohalobacter halotolerans TaxID=1883405 RepID=A0A4V6AL91_9FLAO|nr:nucleotidyl transferase AbiEii/AbiGii toxin family protein [Mesohalobacter halotolerans]TKS55665.1 nucleotidyl transferase AbiEii/AbiGii toxin family protein [Mesohalobacter halotolerans]
MILQKEIIEQAKQWQVPADTVDKDYVLGHFLSVFIEKYKDDLVFKGGTCLRKCYIENYRFSEDLDFTAVDKAFVLEQKTLSKIVKQVTAQTGILFFIEPIKKLLFKNELKGYQVKLKYWGANHSRNQAPPPHNRWNTKIKLEISTDESLLLESSTQVIMHPYSDALTGLNNINCYDLKEVISEKLRALKQRSYTAPRDFYDLYYLTKDFNKEDWHTIKLYFLKKMKLKNLEYTSPKDLIEESKLTNVEKAWKNSIQHQIKIENQADAHKIITTVAQRIKKYL